MKRFFAILMLALAFVSCDKDNFEQKTNSEGGYGTLMFADLSIGVDESVTQIGTRAVSEADGAYRIIITHSDNTIHFDGDYQTAKAGISLPATKDGESYTLVARSTASDVPAAAFDAPVYGATVKDIKITAGQPTTLSDITCTLLQHKVTVDYNDDFKNMVRGNCTTTVTYNNNTNAALNYALTYDNGTVRRDERAGYFNYVENGNTLEVTFVGYLDLEGNGEAKNYRQTKAFTDVAPQTWRHITFIKKIDEEGNATFDIEISDYVEDDTLTDDNEGTESTLGNDPNKPQGDGGITLIGTGDFTDLSNIVIPEQDEPEIININLTMQASVPNGLKKLLVVITSDSDAFTSALNVVAEVDEDLGGHVVDLVNPTEKNTGIFDIVPFPNGSELIGKTVVDFDLSKAQTPILAFPGTHTFKMIVTDSKGCQKEVTITMVVPDYGATAQN